MNPLTKKLGPLPVGVWALIGGGGLLLYRHYHSSGATATPSSNGLYTDAAGNVYDANGNLITPAVGNGSGGLGMSGSDGGTSITGGNVNLNPLLVPLHNIEKAHAKEEKMLASLAAQIKRRRKPKHHRAGGSNGKPQATAAPRHVVARRPKAPRVHHPKRHSPAVAQHGR